MQQYNVRKIYIKPGTGMYAYLAGNCTLAKNMYNAALFRLRNNFTARCKLKNKEPLTSNEQEVQDEITAAVLEAGISRPGTVLSYTALEKVMRVNDNPDFFAGLPMQSAQQVLKTAHRNFKAWLAALKRYKEDAASFTGRPRMPKYVKGDMAMVKFTNQDCRLRASEGGQCLKFPLTKETAGCGRLPEDARLKEVQCRPEHGGFLIFVIYETTASDAMSDMPYTATADFGVDNLAAIVTNAGVPCRIYRGGVLKAENQWYNKRMAELKTAVMQEHDPGTFHCPQTRQMDALSRRRTFFLDDYMHKAAKDIVAWCLRNRIGTFICGVNPGWKQDVSMGKVNNQNFVQIPFFKFRQILAYLCGRNGIRYIEQEESYTSKASSLDGDFIPVYKKGDGTRHAFSGRRVKRGLYRTADGTEVNADLNGAANIGRKYDPGIFAGTNLKETLKNLEVVRFGDLYKTKSNGLIPRTAAA